MIEQQDPLFEAQSELRYMKQTVAALRDELEHARQQSEIGQLQATVHALRDQIEAAGLAT